MTVRMADMSWRDYEDRIAGGAVVMLPVGSIEQHGHHLPLGVDRYLPVAVAEEAARALNAVVAEPVVYGARSQMRMGGGETFPGTTSLRPETLMAVLRDVLGAFIRHGALKIAIVNGHYENAMFTYEAADMALADARAAGREGAKIMRFEYWDYLTADTIEALFPDGYPGMTLEHAALIETSLMLHFHADLVRMDRLPEEKPGDFPIYDLFPPSREGVPPSGALSPPNRACAAFGARIAADCVRGIRRDIAKVFS